jgi:hypothetical protein
MLNLLITSSQRALGTHRIGDWLGPRNLYYNHHNQRCQLIVNQLV